MFEAGLCKGSTPDSDSVCKGSNPFTAAIKKELIFSSFLFVYNAKVG